MGSPMHDSNTWYLIQIPDIWYLIPDTWYPKKGGRAAAAGSGGGCRQPFFGYQVSGIRYPVLCIRYQVLVFGIRYWNQVLESMLESLSKSRNHKSKETFNKRKNIMLDFGDRLLRGLTGGKSLTSGIISQSVFRGVPSPRCCRIGHFMTGGKGCTTRRIGNGQETCGFNVRWVIWPNLSLVEKQFSIRILRLVYKWFSSAIDLSRLI